MKNSDFVGAQSYLCGEDFRTKAKEKLEAVAVQKKIVYSQPIKGTFGLSGGYPASIARAVGVADNR